MAHILIVEDDRALCQGIRLTLRDTARDFTLCHDLAAARRALQEGEYDLMILDINLPDGSGLDFCAQIRGGFDAPILFLTANDTELDLVAGLETGGDDYMTKPFSLAVLRARVGALLRRGNRAVRESRVVIDDFSFDFDAMLFLREGRAVDLSKTEQRLLHILVSNRGVTVPRQRLLDHIWPDGSEFVEENALSVAIRRLRAKLEADPGNPRYIKTVYGIGYLWEVGE